MKTKNLLIIITILFIGCSSTVGQKLPPGNYVNATDGQPKRITLKHLILEYQATIDKQQNIVTAVGNIIFIPEALVSASGQLDRVHIKAHLIDGNRTVIREVSFNKAVVSTDMRPIPFKLSFPFDEKYRFVAFSYRINYFH